MRVDFSSLRILLVVALFGVAIQPVRSQESNAESSKSDEATKARRPEVVIETTEGQIVLELNPEKAPETVANFLRYVADGHYDGTVFHRVIKDFMIQGGGMNEQLREKKTHPPVRNEAGNGLLNKEYTIAMARTSDPDSATCQFFINVKDNTFLDRNDAQGNAGYTVFGRVIKGLDVVDKIEVTPTYSRPNPQFPAMLMRDVPITPVVIKSAALREDR